MQKELTKLLPGELAEETSDLVTKIHTKLSDIRDIGDEVVEHLEALIVSDPSKTMSSHWESDLLLFVSQMERIKDTQRVLGHVGLGLKE